MTDKHSMKMTAVHDQLGGVRRKIMAEIESLDLAAMGASFNHRASVVGERLSNPMPDDDIDHLKDSRIVYDFASWFIADELQRRNESGEL